MEALSSLHNIPVSSAVFTPNLRLQLVKAMKSYLMDDLN